MHKIIKFVYYSYHAGELKPEINYFANKSVGNYGGFLYNYHYRGRKSIIKRFSNIF